MARAEVHLIASDHVNMPGEELKMSLSVKTEGEKIGSLKIEFQPPPELEYVKATIGLFAETAGAQMTTGGADSPQVELSGGDAGIPDGVVASLHFKVKSDAEIGKTVKLEPKVTARSAGGEEIPVGFEAGRVTVSGVPMPSCFFYMH